MLRNVDAQELRDWQLYEASEGPLNDKWDREILAQMHEMMQVQITQDSKKINKIERPWMSYEPRKTTEEIAAEEEREKQATIEALNRAIDAQNKR